MPELNPSPKFPITEKPRLSPNPKSTLEYKDGGRGTPVIVNTDPAYQQEAQGGATFDPSSLIAEINSLKAYVINGDEEDVTAQDVINIVHLNCDAVKFGGEESVIGLVTYKYDNGNYFVSVLLDKTSVGLGYETIAFEVVGGVLSYTKNSLTGNLEYLTIAPRDPNTNGKMKLVVLDEEPASYQTGFLYFITENAE